MRAARWLVPAPADVVALLFLFLVSVVRGWQALNTDGDLGRHIRVGDTILDRGGLFHADLFSWTMHGRPFVPYEWASEVLFALAHRAAGLSGVLVLTAAAVASSYLLLSLLLRRLGVDPLLGFLVTVAAGLASAFHWLARPHVFTLLGTVLLMGLLERRQASAPESRARERLTLRHGVATVALFAVWANLHGGVLFGLVLIGMYVTGDVLDARARVPRNVMLLSAALVGTFINPVGPALLTHLTGYLGTTYLVDMTMEYRSPDFHAWYGRVFLIILLAGVAGLALSRHRIAVRHLLVFLGTTAFALHSARNIPLWALTGLVTATVHLDPDWRGLRLAILARLRAAFEVADRLASTGPWSAAGLLALCLLAGAGGRVGGAQLLQDRFDPYVFPVEGVRWARERGLDGRIFNELAWGGYILVAWPEQRVFIDAQTDFYGEDLSREYVALRGAEAGWREALDSRDVDLVLMPPDAPLVGQLVRMDWTELFRSDGAVLLQHPGAKGTTTR